MMKKVVVTGLGAITPLGNNVDAFWNSIAASKCGIDYIATFDTNNSNVKVAAEVKDYNWKNFFKPIDVKKTDRFTQLALVSSYEAFNDAGLNESNIDKERLAVVFGSSVGGSTLGIEYNKLVNKGPAYVSPMTIPLNIVNMAAANISIKFQAFGGSTSVITACSTGTDCIGQAFRQIKAGYSDIAIAGASEACINPLLISSFDSLKAISRSTDPLRASIPFDNERNGFVLGEGSGTIILEELDHALKRNAKIYAEVVGYGSTSDAYNIVSPDPSLHQGIRAIELALREAGISYKDISYINAHGTGTKYNDKFESQIIEKIFYKDNNRVPVSSTKSMTGHLLGASGAIESIICIKSLQDNFIPATIGFKEKDEDCNLDYVFHKGRKSMLNYVLSNSLGFGGHNASMIFKKL
ncbi:beta-ketoacyl-ACP synthase II [Clostridium butyricum]|uniref:beta-ketoacyl-ACP synthase II n=1 Tax=Clostridium butyricum TaxID=1492 RepID=UPI0034658CEB